MPRGESKYVGTIRGNLALSPGAGLALGPEDACRAIKRTVSAFTEAWYWGDEAALRATLHPDHLNRLLTLGDDKRPLGVQAALGAGIAPERRTASIRVLDLRPASASAVAELHGWVVHLHLAKASGAWRVVNALWETRPVQGA
ncbi:nuclear transport factor 2 family protein [Mesoterricola sediminis]|uniref:Lumazine-binding protein n=1 Tax=Mesoterricola sediminis TaxID=2927980 RepID=A0AA48HFY5_9BACT|nr:nuclear transport factor 2 family protein [Mesoterricola sediminis]BDU77508.1 hypothetical protein METESE_24660 [Mesoterricola sediminis]